MFAKTVRVVPEPSGFKLDYIRPGSFLWEVGLKPGDVVEKWDGLDLNSPLAVSKAYSYLLNKNATSAEIDRNGCAFTLTLTRAQPLP